MRELYPRLVGLALRARRWDVGLNIDAEESGAARPFARSAGGALPGAGLAGMERRRLLCEQAYAETRLSGCSLDHRTRARDKPPHHVAPREGPTCWDSSEIKRAPVEGLEGFSVFARKVQHRCLRHRLRQIAAGCPGRGLSGNSPPTTRWTVARICTRWRASNFRAAIRAFQCLHGMRRAALQPDRRQRARASALARELCAGRSHGTLLACSRCRRSARKRRQHVLRQSHRRPRRRPSRRCSRTRPRRRGRSSPVGAPHPRIALPRDTPDARRARNSAASISATKRSWPNSAKRSRRTRPPTSPAGARPDRQPADRRDIVGWIVDADPAGGRGGLRLGARRAPGRNGTGARRRAARGHSRLAAALFEQNASRLAALICREAGKTLPNAPGATRGESISSATWRARSHSTSTTRRNHPLGIVAAHPVRGISRSRSSRRSARRRARRRHRRRRQDRRGNAADRGRGRAADARGGRSRRRAGGCCSGDGSGRRPRSPANPHVAGAHVHGIDRRSRG